MRLYRLATWLVVWSALSAATAEITPAKLAVVDVSTTVRLPAGFLDLLMADLSQHPGIALLERAEIDRLLREHTLGLTKGTDAISAGHLWAVDAFVLLEMGKPDGKSSPLRVRLVETRYGIQLWDFLLLLEKKPEQYPQQASLLATVIPQRLDKLRCGKDDPIAISVLPLRSEEVSARWSWLAEALAGGVEQNLGLQPRIIVLERSRTRPLTDERSIIPDLPPALLPAAVTLDGAYRLNREKGGEVLAVDLRARRSGAVFWETKLEGSVGELGALCRRAAEAVLQAVAVPVECAPLDAAKEAQMLAAEAGRCAEVKEFNRAMHLAEAALALQPENSAYATLVLEYLGRTKEWAYFNEKLNPETTVPYLRYGLSLLDRALRYRRPGMSYKHQEGSQYNAILDDFVRSVPKMELLTPGVADDLRDLFWDLLKRWKAEPMDGYERAHVVFTVKSAINLIHSPEEAIQYAEQAWLEAVDAFRKDPAAFFCNGGYVCLESFMAPQWYPTPAAERLYVQLLERHASDREPLIRTAVEYSMIMFHTDTNCSTAIPAQAVPHLDKFAEVLETHFLPSYAHRADRSRMEYITTGPLRRQFAPQPAEDIAIKLRYGNRLTEFVLASGNSNYVFTCLSAISTTAKLLEQNGRPEAAAEILKRTLTVFGSSNRNQFVLKLVGQLHALRPDEPLARIGTLSVAYPQAKITVCFPGDSRTGMQFQRIIPCRDGWTLFYVRGRQEVGILGLDANFQPTRRQSIQLVRPPYSASDQSFHRYPELCAEGTDVYAGIYGRGIIWFSNDREPVQFCETNGLPGEAIESLAVLDRKVYAVIAGSLVQLNPATGTSKVLFPSRVAKPTNEIEGHSQMRVLANPARTSLWVHVSGKHQSETQTTWESIIYLYHPDGHTWERRTKPKDPCASSERGCLKYSGGSILSGTGFLCVQYDHDLNIRHVTETNLDSPQCASVLDSGLATWSGGQLLFLRNGPRQPPYCYRSQAAGMDIGKYRDPEHLVDPVALQAQRKHARIRDLLATPDRLLVLLDDKLLCITGLTDKP